ncbi:MAG: magnesium/cobalt transporter CorA [Candidatus Omnitrophica bacterium]|nr:magnesium/cobalt transporter CorA [Candidatus Omnitrophota bacterium]
MIELLFYDTAAGQCTVTGDANEIKTLVKKPDGILWLDIEKPTYSDMEILEQGFNFHPLAIEDCMTTIQRPKIDKYIGGYLFVVLHAASLGLHKDKATSKEVDFFIGNNFLITVHVKSLGCITACRERCVKNPTLMGQGPGYLFYTVADALVDNYFPILDRLGTDIEKVEQMVHGKNENGNCISRILSLKDNVLTLRRFIGPQKELVNSLARGDYQPFISSELSIYFRDIYDLLAQISDTLDSYRDELTNILDGYRSVTANNLNEVMKVLTMIATIMMPLTVVGSIYGMNFKHMPELEWRYGYFFALALMMAIGLSMLVFFKTKKWI